MVNDTLFRYSNYAFIEGSQRFNESLGKQWQDQLYIDCTRFQHWTQIRKVLKERYFHRRASNLDYMDYMRDSQKLLVLNHLYTSNLYGRKRLAWWLQDVYHHNHEQQVICLGYVNFFTAHLAIPYVQTFYMDEFTV